QTHPETKTFRRWPTQLFRKAVISSAGHDRILRAQAVRHDLKYGSGVVVETSNQPRIHDKLDAARAQIRLQFFKMLPAVRTQALRDRWQFRKNGLTGRHFTIEDPEWIPFAAALAILAQPAHPALDLGPECLDELRAALAVTDGVHVHIEIGNAAAL